MDQRTKNISDILTLIGFLFAFLGTITQSPEHQIEILILSFLLASSFLARSYTVSDKIQVIHRYEVPLIIFEIMIVTIIMYFDQSGASQIYYFILIADAVLYFSIKFALSLTLLIFLAFMINAWIALWPEMTLNDILVIGLLNGIGYIFVFLITYLVKHQVNQRNFINETLKELEYKNKKLEESQKQLENMAVIKERNRIAHDIHDTVGHTLTTVLVGTEAAKRLIDKDPELAKEKLSLAQDQVRKGLNNIKNSIKDIKDHNEIIDFNSAVNNLIHETEQQTDIEIDCHISVSEDQISQTKQKVILRALQEGLTNGIKHGNSTYFKFNLIEDQEYIYFDLEDNGTGSEDKDMGFGLNFMKDRVEELGGSLTANSKQDGGFILSIEIPVEEGEEL
ncbi:sensor histidine kinase [Natranaerobius thermophilus]|uniref:histidine kinase n=1 Tax=Natranaerobius thermophilus (strain ATCC BAA-1301 / DSM 18059 / JW/NM-WN-LF) TaxID=457570 RepID=B2A7N6_NATTJ|nr:sensor histidine kinase [Natranaerobius thermophilus]ACB84338.1 integral membrane sensor signal transduction histidine kinase [Natranaerobius thermophilus JW/NM-WN-LF]